MGRNNIDPKAKKAYKGPFQKNPNFRFQTTKSNMHPQSDGPTVDIFSDSNGTTNIHDDEFDAKVVKSQNKRPRRKRNKAKDFINDYLKEIIIGFVVIGVSSFFSIVVFNHSNHFVGVDKDIDFLKESKKTQESDIRALEKNTNEIDKNLELLEQKVDYKIVEKK